MTVSHTAYQKQSQESAQGPPGKDSASASALLLLMPKEYSSHQALRARLSRCLQTPWDIRPLRILLNTGSDSGCLGALIAARLINFQAGLLLLVWGCASDGEG